MKKIIITISIFSILLYAIETNIAQPPPPPFDAGNPSGGGGEGPVGAPIDGGLGILLAMGAAYGGRKLYKGWKEKKEQEELDGKD